MACWLMQEPGPVHVLAGLPGPACASSFGGAAARVGGRGRAAPRSGAAGAGEPAEEGRAREGQGLVITGHDQEYVLLGS
jgi:hypothetical protein